jgi:hypothetical protein
MYQKIVKGALSKIWLPIEFATTERGIVHETLKHEGPFRFKNDDRGVVK